VSHSNTVSVTKASGETESFDVLKLRGSLNKAGADAKVIDAIAGDIKDWLYEGVSTRKIYARAFRMLRRQNRINALRYKLKKSLYEFGPTGYPFEHFIGEIFKRRGFSVEVGKVLQGKCITHEMDVIARRNSEQFFIECKYSRDQGHRVSIQVPLYVRSRIDDIVMKRKTMQVNHGSSYSGGIATNTRFSTDSINYAKCSDLYLLGWDYPDGDGLKEIIERERIFPITILDLLTKTQKFQLLEQGIVTCKQLIDNKKILEEFDMGGRKLRNVADDLVRILED